MYFKLKNKFGFTLVEMMVVVSIIGILSAMTVVNFRSNEKERQMENQSLTLLNGIKKIQTSALSGGLVSGEVPLSYRFEISKCLTNCSFSLTASTTSGIVDIDPNVLLSSSKVDLVDGFDVSIANDLMVEILPPRGKILLYTDGIEVADNEVIIKLEHTNDSSILKHIKINGISGRMDLIK